MSTSCLAPVPSMTLTAVLAEYLSEREVCRNYADSMGRTVRRAAAYGIVTTSQLDPALVNGFLGQLREERVSAVTRANTRRMLLTVWRYAAERGYTHTLPWKVAKVKAPLPPVRAWSVDTLKRLLEAAEQDRRPVNARYPNLEWRHVLPVWIAVGFETGLRLGDLLSLNIRDLHNGCISVVAQKTGKTEIKRVSAYAQRGMERLAAASRTGSVFGWCCTRRRALVKWKAWLKEQGINGSSKFLRRSSFTYTEIKRPGTAHRFANHSNPTLVWLHYIDRTLLSPPDGPDPLR